MKNGFTQLSEAAEGRADVDLLNETHESKPRMHVQACLQIKYT